MMSSDINLFLNCFVLFLTILIGSTLARSGLHSEQSAPPSRVQQCREGCLEKFATEDFACLQGPECSMCWDQCAAPTKINTSILDTWSLRAVSLIRQDSLVSADVAWPPLNAPSQCLVTWEVAGGGLMGNLLTESSSVELSLWPETKYRVQVTCKNKQTEVITRSLPLTLDTSRAIIVPSISTPIPSTTKIPSTTHLIDIIDPNIDLDLSINYIQHNRLRSNQKQTTSITDYGIWTIYDSRKEVILGTCTAILVFLCVLAVFILNLRRTRPSDKESLIENEVSPDIQTQTVHV